MKLLCIFGLTTAALLSFGQTNNQPATANNPSFIANTGRRPRQIGQFMRATTNGAPSAIYVVGEQGANHRTWLKVLKTTDLKGHTLFHTNVAYVELASGLNYKDPVTGNLLPSREEIDAYPGGAIAQYGQHKVIFADNLNTSGAIDLQTPDGKDLQSDILGLAYYDSASGKSVLVAQLKDCQGEIVNSNQVIYSDAFIGVRANVRYTYTRAGLEQDVVLLAQPPPPETFGLSSSSSVLQVLTEFTTSPTPTINYLNNGTATNGPLIDESLDFGSMRMMPGRAFLLGTNSPSAPVCKQWLNMNGRTVLVESVSIAAIKDSLSGLPAVAKLNLKPTVESVQYVVSGRHLLPPQRAKGKTSKKMELARSSALAQGFVLDYVIVNGTQPANYTFQGDTTYEISGSITLNGTNITFEPGTVIKYDPGSEISFGYSPYANITCQGTPYRPIIFTARDDDSVGETLADSTHTISGNYASYALSMGGPNLSSASYFRMLYTSCGMFFYGGSPTISDAQFIDCQTAFKFNTCPINVHNALFSGVSTVFYDNMNYYGSGLLYNTINATFDNVSCIFNNAGGTLSTPQMGIANSIMASTTQITTGSSISLTGHNNGFYNCSTTFGSTQFSCTDSPFQTVGEGNYYLNNDPNGGKELQGVGTAITFLKGKTTQPPIALPALMPVSGDLTLSPQVPRYASGNPDLGYYYDALDYTVATMVLEGGNLTVLPGTAIGMRNDYIASQNGWTTIGFAVEQGSSVTAHGFPTNLITFTSTKMVQEQPETSFAQYQTANNIPFSVVTFVPDFELDALGSPAPTFDFRFCSFSLPGPDYHFWSGISEDGSSLFSPDSTVYMSLRDCNLCGGRIDFGQPFNPSTFPSAPWTYPADQVYGTGSISWVNNLFNRVNINLDPTYFENNLDDQGLNADMQVQAYNNLFRGGTWFHLEPIPASAGDWTFENNFFDNVDIVQDVNSIPSGSGTAQPLDFDYNGYWPLTASQLLTDRSLYPWTAEQNSAELQPTTTSDGFTDGTAGNHEVILSSAPPYVPGPLGNYYMQTGTSLSSAGAFPPADSRVGLSQYTTRTDQTKELGQSQVDIGLHYIATTGSTSATPMDTDGPRTTIKIHD